ncbi:MAG: hypothetical protein ABIJ23_02600 [Candidatus Magasanikbacteria bacterium]
METIKRGVEGKEIKKKLNWHLTMNGMGSWSVGATEDMAGYYPADEDKGTAESWVAPADYIESHPSVREFGFQNNAIKEAIEAWKNEQGK